MGKRAIIEIRMAEIRTEEEEIYLLIIEDAA